MTTIPARPHPFLRSAPGRRICPGDLRCHLSRPGRFCVSNYGGRNSLCDESLPLGRVHERAGQSFVAGLEPGAAESDARASRAGPGVTPLSRAPVRSSPIRVGSTATFCRKPSTGAEQRHRAGAALSLPVIINGRIGRSGDWDVFQFPANPMTPWLLKFWRAGWSRRWTRWSRSPTRPATSWPSTMTAKTSKPGSLRTTRIPA